MNKSRCRFCGTSLEHTFCDLGATPLSNAFIKPDRLHAAETFYPLHVYVCARCYLVQLEEFETPERIFSDYSYFSSFSDTWLQHARDYASQAIQRFSLTPDHLVVELASNDGYLLQYFKQAGLPVLGVEPARNVAQAAVAAGIPTRVDFFGTDTAAKMVDEGIQADLLIGNNVLAHVPDINDFVAGMGVLLKPSGRITMEFPHLLKLMQENQFDTIYHEHFSYLSLGTVREIFLFHGLTVFDVEELSTHGGSLRIHARHYANTAFAVSDRVEALLNKETEYGMSELDVYGDFGARVKALKRDILSFLIEAKNAGKSIAGYGAPAKGNTLLNYCGIGCDFLDYTVDRSPHKQGCLLPGSRIPVYPPDWIRETKPDYVFVLPWNLKDEIMAQMVDVREWGGRFVFPIPRIQVAD